MGHDMGDILKTVREVEENIWLGDYETAKKIADSNLADLQKDFKIYALQDFAEDMRKTLRELKDQVREGKIEDEDSWIAERIIEKMKLAERKPTDNIMGVLVIQLLDMREMLDFLTQPESQTTIGEFMGREPVREEVFRVGERYRFATRKLPDRWEVRTIVDEPTKEWNLMELKRQLPDSNISPVISLEGRLLRTLEIFSKDMYAEALFQEKQIEFSIHTATPEDAPQRIRKFVETTLTSLLT